MYLHWKTKGIFFFFLFLGQYGLAQDILLSNENTTIQFEINHLKLLTVKGAFDDFNGSISKHEDSWIVSGSIDVGSINTANESRDETLNSEPYLNVSTYPEILFEGAALQVLTGFSVAGILTIKDLNETVNFEFIRDGDFLKSNGLVISRKLIGLSFGSMDLLIGDEIQVLITINTSR